MQKKKVANRRSQSTQRVVRRRSDNQLVINTAFDPAASVNKATDPGFDHAEEERVRKIIEMVDDSLDFIDSNHLEASAGEKDGNTYIMASVNALNAKNMMIATGAAISRETDALIIDDIGYRNYMDLIDNAKAEAAQINKATELLMDMDSSHPDYAKLKEIQLGEKIDGSSAELGRLRASKTIGILSKMRNMSGTIPHHYASIREAGDLLGEASRFFPMDWCDRSSAYNDVYVRKSAPGELDETTMAEYSHGATFTAPMYEGGQPVDQRGSGLSLNRGNLNARVVTHELGHRFSNLYPDIEAMELATIADTGRGFSNPLVQGFSTSDGDIKIERETSEAQDYSDSNRVMVPRNSVSDEYAYSFNMNGTPELFPTGVEALFGGGKRTADSIAERDNFALGVLATIR